MTTSPRARVLIVDDDQGTLEVTQALLEDAGYEVSIRATPVGTGAQIQREQPDIVLLDVNMPALKGDRIAEIIVRRGRQGRSRIVFFSGAEEDALQALCDKHGALGWIRKSGDHQAFLEDFERLVALARSSQGTSPSS
jgi:CheY-like chemotaxis protein